MIRALKVIVTMFVNDSLLNMMTEPSIITQAWKMDFHIHIKKVLVDSTRPFCRVE